MTRPLVSVLIDTYNHQDFVERAILSVLEQDLARSDLEIIVVDDGSTDGTAEVVQKWAHEVRLLRKPNGGQASAFNAAVAQCHGELVAFLDGDDWWRPDKLRLVLEEFEKDPELGTVGHGLYETQADGQSYRALVANGTFRFDLHSTQNARIFAHLRWCLGASRLTLRRSLLDRILPIPEALVIEADEWMFTLAPAMAPVLVLDKPLFYYRLHEGNLFQFSRRDELKLRRRQAVLEVLLRRLPPRLRELGIQKDVVDTVMEPTWVDAERIGLSLDGGNPWRTFKAERVGYRYSHVGASVGYRAFNGLILGLALVLPPRRFYRLREWYATKNLARYRSLFGEPRMAAPVLARKVAEQD